MSVLPRGNNALLINPPTGDAEHLNTHGSDWLWAVFAVYAFSLLAVVALTYFTKSSEKIFHYLFTVSLFVGTISYFAAASDLGSIPVGVADTLSKHGPRQIFYSRYINWFVGWTPLVIAVGLISGVSWATIVYDVALIWTWTASWLAGALIDTTYKWGFFVFGTFAYFLLAASLLGLGSKTAKRVGVQKHYFGISGWMVFLWLIYPIAWGVDDGGNVIGVTSGWIFIGVLDVLLVPVTSFVILLLSRRWDYRSMNLYFTQYGRVLQGGEHPEREKESQPAGGPTGVVEPPAAV